MFGLKTEMATETGHRIDKTRSVTLRGPSVTLRAPQAARP